VPHRSTKILALAVMTALAAAACGSSANKSGSSTHASAGAGGNQAVEFSACMRSHGLPSFPDPDKHGDLLVSPSSGLNPQSPAFQRAQAACARYMPGGGGPPQKMTASQYRAAVKFSECMRTHGVPTFPDPLASAPKGAGPVLSLHGMMFAPGPGFDPAAPAFHQGAVDCGVRLPSAPPS
jgi:hypothetical protein